MLHAFHSRLRSRSPFLLSSCQADDPTAHGVMTEPGVLASGYWIPDGIAVISEGELLALVFPLYAVGGPSAHTHPVRVHSPTPRPARRGAEPRRP